MEVSYVNTYIIHEVTCSYHELLKIFFCIIKILIYKMCTIFPRSLFLSLFRKVLSLL